MKNFIFAFLYLSLFAFLVFGFSFSKEFKENLPEGQKRSFFDEKKGFEKKPKIQKKGNLPLHMIRKKSKFSVAPEQALVFETKEGFFVKGRVLTVSINHSLTVFEGIKTPLKAELQKGGYFVGQAYLDKVSQGLVIEVNSFILKDKEFFVKGKALGDFQFKGIKKKVKSYYSMGFLTDFLKNTNFKSNEFLSDFFSRLTRKEKPSYYLHFKDLKNIKIMIL